MSISNFQWRHDGLRWRIKLMQIPLLRACFIAEQERGYTGSESAIRAAVREAKADNLREQ